MIISQLQLDGLLSPTPATLIAHLIISTFCWGVFLKHMIVKGLAAGAQINSIAVTQLKTVLSWCRTQGTKGRTVHPSHRWNKAPETWKEWHFALIYMGCFLCKWQNMLFAHLSLLLNLLSN